MIKKIISLGVFLIIAFSLSACSMCDMGETRIPRELEKRYPGAFGKYQYAGYVFTSHEDSSKGGCGVEPEDIFNPEYSEFEQQEIYEYIISALDFTGREVELTTAWFQLKENFVYNYFPSYFNDFTEIGFDFPWAVAHISNGIEGKASFEYNSDRKESIIYIYFILDDVGIDLTLVFTRSF